MAGMNPSIVSASLDDKQLRDSISNLVNTVKKQTDKMANDFDSAIEKMNKSLKKLGAVGASSGGDATDTSKVKQNTQAVEENTAARKKNAQAAKEQKMTLDQMAQAQQQVTAPKSARESYYAFQQGFKAQAQKIAQQIKDAEAALNASVLRRTEELTSKLTVAKQRLNELNIELSKQRMEAEKTGNYSNYNAGISRTQQAIEYQMRRIAELQRQISEVSPNMFTEQVQKIGILRSEYERISNIMKDEATASQQQLNLTDAQKQKLSELESQYARLKKEREEASKAYQEAGWQRFGAKIQAGAYPNDPNVQKQLADAEEKLRVATERLNKVKAEQAQLDKEISAFKNTLSASTKQNTQSQQQATIAASKYTDEIKKQAQAIRESQQWKEKGYATVGDRSYYDPDRSNMAKKERLSLEEQILKTITEQQTAEQQAIVTENAVTESAKEEARIREMMRQGIVATNEALEKARSLSTKGIGVTIGDKDGTVNTFTTKLESAKRLSEELKKLKTQYDNLDLGQRKGNEAQNIAIKIREITRQVQILSRELNRPTKKEIAGLSEKTLDDISYKMKQLQAYRQGIDLTKPNAAAEIKQVDSELQRLQKDADKWMSKQKSMIEGNNALGRSWNYMKNRLAFYFTVGASTQFVRQLVEVRSQYEMNERALGILINSAERGTQIFQELSRISLVSPYTLIELSTAAKQLTAYDVAAKDVVDTTRRLADMAAAVGTPIERLTYALGQIKAYGYLNSRDARMFANAGIPLVKELSKYYTEVEGKMVSIGDVYDRMKKKAIDYGDVMSVVNNMTDKGGKFFDFQAKMADTLKVRLANLNLAWNNMLNDIGKDSQGVLTSGIGALRTLFLHWREIKTTIESIAWGAGLLVAVRALNVLLVKMGFTWRILSKEMTAAGIAGQTAATKVATAWGGLMSLLKSGIFWWTLIAVAVVDYIRAVNNADEAQKEFNRSLREGAESSVKEITSFLEQYRDLRNSLYKESRIVVARKNRPDGIDLTEKSFTPVDIKEEEAKKAWEAMAEQIQIATSRGDEYVGKLLQIKNVSERLRQGFTILDSINEVDAALKELNDDTIKISDSLKVLWITFESGLVDSLKDYIENADYDTATIGNEIIRLNNQTDRSLDELRSNLKKTTDSIINFIEMKDWSGDTSKINETFDKIIKSIALKNNLDPKEAYVLQLEVEEARANAAKKALVQRIRDEKEAFAIEANRQKKKELANSINRNVEELKVFDMFNGRRRVEWERFTKWMKEQHLSEMSSMFRGINSEQIKSLDFQKGKYAEWVKKMTTQYAKEYKMTYDQAFEYLKSWVTSANQWSIFIPVTIGTPDEKSIYDKLTKADQDADDAWERKERLEKRIGELEDEGKRSTEEYSKAVKELGQATNDYNDALARGGHSKKADRKDTKDLKNAETELQKTLKESIQLIDKARSSYKALVNEGVSSTQAIQESVRGYESSIKHINEVFSKYGIGTFDLTKFVGIQNPRGLVEMMEGWLNKLKTSGVAKPEEVQQLEVKINELKIDAVKYDTKAIADGLNNELGKLKDEYELAIDLEANPELGGIFADLIGIGDEQLKDLPKDFDSLLKKMQAEIDKSLGENRFNLAKNLNKSSFDKWLKANEIDVNSEQAKTLKAFVDYANKVRQDETKKQVAEWNKLLEKYAEYETKKKQILDEYNREREIALKKNADERILSSIENRRNERIAELDFNEFMKTPEWVTATGNLAGMSKRAIDMLIDKINEYKKSAKYLSPKQIKQLNQALKQLHAEQKKNNPFKAISNMLAESSERMANFDDKIKETEKEIDGLQKKRKADIVDGISDEETNKSLKNAINRLKELKEAREKAGEVDASDWVNSINEVTTAIQGAVNVVNELAEAIGGFNNEPLKDAFSVIGKAGSAAAIGAAIGGGYGAAIGAVVGAATGVFSLLAGSSNGNIDKKIKRSEAVVESLTNSYKLLEEKIEDAYGAAEYGYKKAAIANKELQVIELKRQLQLEESRDSKDRDSEKIESLKGQIIDLEVEIRNATEDIVNDLLGISSVGDAAEQLVSSMIESFKNGEDYMKVFQNSFDDMVDNMIMKAIVGKIIGERIESIYEKVKENAEKRAGDEDYTFTTWNDHEKTMALNEAIEYIKEKIAKANETNNVNKREYWEKELEKANAAYANAMTPTPQDVKDISSLTEGFKDDVKSEFEAWMDAFGIAFGQDSTKNLSALQQGIQGITEDTAGALEAYMNGVSQQVYQQTEYLRQIAEVMNRDDDPTDDVKVASLSQILLQLRSSYEMQTAIHSIIDSWNGQSTAYACNVRIVP